MGKSYIDQFYFNADPSKPNTLSTKKDYNFNLFIREASYFSRHCEVYGNFTRLDAYNALSAVVDVPEKRSIMMEVVVMCTSFIPLIPIILICLHALKKIAPS